MNAKFLPLIALAALAACANSGEPAATSAAPSSAVPIQVAGQPPAVYTPPAAAPAVTPAPAPTTTPPVAAPAAPPAAAAPAPPPAAVTSAGVETFLRVCSGCHAPELVADKRLDRAGWDEVVQTMIGRGAAASDAEAKVVTDYLARTYPAG